MRLRVPGVPERLAAQATAFVHGLRRLDLAKPPGVAETIDWAQALAALGQRGARRGGGRVDARLGAQVLRGPRDGAGHGSRPARRRGSRRCPLSRSAAACLHLRARAARGRPGDRAGPAGGRLDRALDHVDVTEQDDVYWALRTTLVARREDLDAFDQAFAAWFLRAPSARPSASAWPATARGRGERTTRRDTRLGEEAGAPSGEATEIGWSAHEILRAKDFAAMSPEEFARTRALISQIVTARPSRRTRRLRPHPRGERTRSAPAGPQLAAARRRPRRADVPAPFGEAAQAGRAVRRVRLHGGLHAGAAPVPARRRRLGERGGGLRLRNAADPADPRAGHARSRGGARGGRGARRRLGERHADRRLAQAVQRPVGPAGALARRRRRDRLGRVGAAGRLARGRGDGPPRAGRLCGRLGQSAQGHPDYQPLAGGMRAALPYVDRFVAGHNVASLEELAEVLAGIERRHAA